MDKVHKSLKINSILKICSNNHPFYSEANTCNDGHSIQKILCPKCLEPIVFRRFQKHVDNCEHSIYNSISFKLKRILVRKTLLTKWKLKIGKLTGYDLKSFIKDKIIPDNATRNDIITKSCIYPLRVGCDVYIFHVIISGSFYTVGKYIPVFSFDKMLYNRKRNGWVLNAVEHYNGRLIQTIRAPHDIWSSARLCSKTNEIYWVFPYDHSLEAVELYQYLPMLIYGMWSRKHMEVMKETIQDVFYFHVIDFKIGYEESIFISN